MEDDRSDERTETDERVAENRTPAPVAPVSRDDPPSERIPAMKPGEAQDQAFGSVNDPIEE